MTAARTTLLHRLPVEGAFDLSATFTCGQAFRWLPEDGGYAGIVGGAELLVRAAERGTLTVEIRGQDPGVPFLASYFRAEEDPAKHLAHAPQIGQIPGVRALLGLRLLRQDPWETLVSFICSAAANMRKITACVEGLARRYGEPIPGARRHAFPTPRELARSGESGLRALGLGFRAPYVLETARRIDRGPWDWEQLRRVDLDEAREALCSLDGVGPKIADCVLLFGLDRLEAYPVDRWIRRATLEMAALRRASDQDLIRWAERLGPGRGYVQQVIFHLRRTSGPLPRVRSRSRPPRGGSRGPAPAAPKQARGSRARGADSRPDRGPAFAIFAKAPVPGQVKTRLVPPLSEEEAARLARISLDVTLRRFAPRIGGSWFLFLAGTADQPLKAAAASLGVRIEPQGTGDLGARLRRAFRLLRSRGHEYIIAIGADSPTLDPARLRESVEGLATSDVVLGPSEDGGYYLVGIRGEAGGIFEAIPWSTPRVLEATRARAKALGLTIHMLASWYDIDDADGLARARADAAHTSPELASFLEAIDTERRGSGACVEPTGAASPPASGARSRRGARLRGGSSGRA